MQQFKMFVDGKWFGQKLEQIDVINPATNKSIGTIPKGGMEEAKQATDAAHAALKEWAARTAEDRSNYLVKWHDLIKEERENIGKIMTAEQGKPLKEAIGEVDYANDFISWYAEEGKRINGDIIPASHTNKRIFVQKQPVGVVAAITPWNFPAAMITRKVAPALAAGCTVVIKPATQTPLTAFKLVELAEKAGIPKGVINIVTGSSSQIGKAWSEDSRIRKLTFTGSTEVGKTLMKDAADTMKKISLELGGHAPFIVMEDANLDKAVAGVVASKFRNAGQTCVCTNRVYVHESIKEIFQEKLAKAVSKLHVGNGDEEGTDIGPLIDQNAIEKVEEQVKDAASKGGNVIFGGKRLEGLFVEPTIVTDATDDMLCMYEETFGPLVPITTFKNEEEVIDRANNSPFGLAAYVFTENIGQAIQISEALEYGIVGLNDGAPSTPQAPFGGFKESGLGREGGYHGIEEFLETKYISLAF
ncbi:NAD-dependent succinate-semialdehyde dehydrogenase [Oceanobacillus oncorhynchi subsp. incaldanensis]|uniref:NAD-dependent succinate-semialdehyde dehydrogenase n=1 Tax=Oceanobacillus oncorhynchi TaxID=545501 RepID=UPI001B246715|nr:NAD-dependent succinate-semialdehyde dehydrogenase [Oceanobacillus oncorhynchi]GIO20426.1 NAD-dependent succinate-semialdehyde dehydrogenase [Oceanobacillus oncorhynchi subsp. incaldanensis]